MSKHRVAITVDNYRCHRYGLCEVEAPEVFRLTADGRLAYRAQPSLRSREDVLMAARNCPMRAIHVETR